MGELVLLPELVTAGLESQALGGEAEQDAIALLSINLLAAGHLVAQAQGEMEQLGSGTEVEQTLGVLAIEEEGGYLVVGDAQAIVEDGHIEEHLCIVLLLLHWLLGIGRWGPAALAALLLHEDMAIELEHVHTSLKSEWFAEEGGLQHHIVTAEP